MNQERRLLYCPTCNAKYDVSGVTTRGRFICKSCRAIVRVPDVLDSVPFFKQSDSIEILKPELVLADATSMVSQDIVPSIEFTKLVATENDYVLLDTFREEIVEPGGIAKMMCHRKRGVGADGVLLFIPTTEADFEMRMFNPDGSEAEMCGNGIRCLARYAYDHEYTQKTRLTIKTKAGIKDIELFKDHGIVNSIKVDMGVVEVLTEKGSFDVIEAAGRSFEGIRVSVGNPHFVIFTSDVDSISLADWGPAIENHELFPQRTNVEFVEVRSPESIVQRTHERGAGETNGCGTGATAVCAAGLFAGKTGSRVNIHLKGGDLQVELDDGSRAFLTGPAVEVFSGTWIPGGIRTNFANA
jgi:diaminopimelate epimerase